MNRAGRDRASDFWATSRVMQIWQGQFLTQDGQINFKSPSDYPDSITKIYIGEIGGVHYFAINGEIDPEIVTANTLREIAGNLSQHDLELAVTALALINWHESHPKCPRCGSDTEIIEHGWVRKCNADGTQHFPRTDPAIIVAVQDRNGRLCLGRQSIWPEGRYSNCRIC
jgi:NAD+ diphosphatase